MGFVPGPGLGGGWGPPGVYTQRHGFKRTTLEGKKSRAKYYGLRYQYAGRNQMDVLRLGFWTAEQAGESPRYWKTYQKLTNYVFMGLPGSGKMKTKSVTVGKALIRSRAGQSLIRKAEQKATQKRLEQAMALKKGLDRQITKRNPVRKTSVYKNASRSKRTAIDAAWLTGVYGAARIAWTTGGGMINKKLFGKRFIRKERY